MSTVHAAETTFTVGWAAAPMDTLNPTAHTLYDAGAYVIAHPVYDTLVSSDLSGKPIPDLAYSWTYKDLTTIDFSLVKNATWHDGQPFTADDVVFSINLYLAHKEFPLMRNYVQTIKSVTAIDQYTVEIQTTRPDATFMDYRLYGVYIIPKHIWESVGNYTTFANSNPIGTGPFKFVRWGGPNTFVEYTANPDYFYGKPSIDRLVFRYFTSYSAMALALQSGEIDYAGPLFTHALVPTLTSTIGVQVVTRPDPRYYYFAFNGYPQGSGNPTLRDKTVRIALSHAINNVELAQVVWGGFALPQNTTVPVSLGDWVNPNTPKYNFDLQEAAQMLDAAGYRVGKDGIRVSPNGIRMSYKIEVPSNYAEEYRAAQLISSWWKQIGVEANAQITEVGALADEVVSWKHDTFIWVWSATSLDPDIFLDVFVGTEAQPAPNPGLSDSGYNNAQYDALYLQQIQETDPAKRRDIVWQMQDILHQDAVYVPLYDPLAVQAFRSDRFTGIPLGTMPPLNNFATNNLLLSIKPITVLSTATTATTTAAPTGIGTETIALIAVVVIAIIVVAIVATRRRSAPGKNA
jgi:peptide/nickel transport system substrate-binding protein